VLLFESILDLSTVRDEFKAMDVELRRLARDYIADGQKAGTIRNDVDAEAHAALALAAVRGLTMQWMVDPDAFDLDRVYAELGRWLERGLEPPSTPPRRTVKNKKTTPARKSRRRA